MRNSPSTGTTSETRPRSARHDGASMTARDAHARLYLLGRRGEAHDAGPPAGDDRGISREEASRQIVVVDPIDSQRRDQFGHEWAANRRQAATHACIMAQQGLVRSDGHCGR